MRRSRHFPDPDARQGLAGSLWAMIELVGDILVIDEAVIGAMRAALLLGVEMRTAQALYFRLRPGPEKQEALRHCKRLEGQFDRAAAAALKASAADQQGGLP
jgi:hypothetical protein